jgi:hypothetical protein
MAWQNTQATSCAALKWKSPLSNAYDMLPEWIWKGSISFSHFARQEYKRPLISLPCFSAHWFNAAKCFHFLSMITAHKCTVECQQWTEVYFINQRVKASVTVTSDQKELNKYDMYAFSLAQPLLEILWLYCKGMYKRESTLKSKQAISDVTSSTQETRLNITLTVTHT